jgi:hypothetical protein
VRHLLDPVYIRFLLCLPQVPSAFRRALGKSVIDRPCTNSGKAIVHPGTYRVHELADHIVAAVRGCLDLRNGAVKAAINCATLGTRTDICPLVSAVENILLTLPVITANDVMIDGLFFKIRRFRY